MFRSAGRFPPPNHVSRPFSPITKIMDARPHFRYDSRTGSWTHLPSLSTLPISRPFPSFLPSSSSSHAHTFSLLLPELKKESSPWSVNAMAPRKHGEATVHGIEHVPEYYQQMEDDFRSAICFSSESIFQLATPRPTLVSNRICLEHDFDMSGLIPRVFVLHPFNCILLVPVPCSHYEYFKVSCEMYNHLEVSNSISFSVIRARTTLHDKRQRYIISIRITVPLCRYLTGLRTLYDLVSSFLADRCFHVVLFNLADQKLQWLPTCAIWYRRSVACG